MQVHAPASGGAIAPKKLACRSYQRQLVLMRTCQTNVCTGRLFRGPLVLAATRSGHVVGYSRQADAAFGGQRGSYRVPGRSKFGHTCMHRLPACQASRDPSRVSLLSADDLNNCSPSSVPFIRQRRTSLQDDNHLPHHTRSAQQITGQQQLDGDSSSILQSDDTANTHYSTHGSSLSRHHSGSSQHSISSGSIAAPFLVSALQLRQIVQAAIDSSQGPAAHSILAQLTAQVQQEQQQQQLTSSGQLAAVLAAALRSELTNGLPGSAADAARRLSAFGSNNIAAAATSSFWQLLLDAASDSTLLLLLAAGGVSLGLAAITGKDALDFVDGAAILASVAICANVTAVTNYQKESKFRQLNQLKQDVLVRVIRGGREESVSCLELLVGDVLVVEAGDILPADGLFIQGQQIKIDESHLTGEADDITKEAVAAPDNNRSSGSGNSSAESQLPHLQSCLLLSGSKVLEGFGRMLVLAVGPNSQQGIIQQLVMAGAAGAPAAAPASSNSTAFAPPSDVAAAALATSAPAAALREATPLTSHLEELAGNIGGVGLAAAAAVLLINCGLYTAELWSAGTGLLDPASIKAYLSFFITSLTLLVVAVPEGLPLAVTLSLAFSVQRMLADNNLVRNLNSCETMAAATSICSDKTGTLTENNMAVVKLFVGGAIFNIRPSAAAAAAATLEAAATALPPSSVRRRRGNGRSASSSSSSSSRGDESTADWQAGGNGSSSSSTSRQSLAADASRHNVAAPAAMSSSSRGWSTTSRQLSAADLLTRVSLSLDQADQVLPATAAQPWQQSPTVKQQLSGVGQSASAAMLAEPVQNAANCDNDLQVWGDDAAETGPVGIAACVKQLLVDSILLNSTASISVLPGSQQQRQPQLVQQELDCMRIGSQGRQLDRRGNRTECALLEFGARLAGHVLPGASDSKQQQQDGVLQVFPFSSSRKRMSSLIATGPPLAQPAGAGTGSVLVGQPARLYLKGAAEMVLDSCRLQVGVDGQLQPLPPAQVAGLKQRCGQGGLRMLAVAYKDVLLRPTSSSDTGIGSSSAEWQLLSESDESSDLVLIGMLGLEDPIRPAVPGAIADCKRAGIGVRMVTGDNAATGAAIAATAGILEPQLAQQVEELAAARSHGKGLQQQVQELRQMLTSLQPAAAAVAHGSGKDISNSGSSRLAGKQNMLAGRVGDARVRGPVAGAALMKSVTPHPSLAVLEGPAFRALVLRPDGTVDLDMFAALWPHLRVLARATPADKYTLVQAVKVLRARGQFQETIAVTGDGTNDAPALTAADVGFAMAAGTSIAKEASDILLLDNNFRSIVSAVKWGRNVYSCVTKFLQFQLTANAVALVTAAGGGLLLRASPLSAVQMLWVNLIMDSLASLALATEEPTDAMLDEAPRNRDGALITPTVVKSIVGQTVLQLGVIALLLGPTGHAVADLGAVAAGAGGDLGEHAAEYTLVFNSFVLMQLFNQVNSRKIHDEANVLDGILHQRLFLVILGLEAALQVAIVQAGGRAFSTVPLTWSQWGVCIGFGALTLLARQALRLIQTEPSNRMPPPGAGGSKSRNGGSSNSGIKTSAAAAQRTVALSAALTEHSKAVSSWLHVAAVQAVDALAAASTAMQQVDADAAKTKTGLQPSDPRQIKQRVV